MTLGVPSTGPAAAAADARPWSGAVPRDEFFWLSEINKATFVINTKQGLLDPAKAAEWARAQERVIEAGNVPGAPRPKMYVRYEPLLIKEAGIDVTAIHAGRSSQDMHATFQRAILRDRTLEAMEALLAVRRALFKLAQENRDTIAPCYTNGVAAQPNSLAHTWLGHLEGFRRDFEGLKEFWKRLNLCPMGTTVLNGTPWPLDREAMAERLGFDGIVENAYDAAQISAVDMAVESALKLTLPLLHVTSFIEDVMTQYAQPRPWILVTATYASTAMPQKRNPGSLIDVRRDANQVLGELSGVIFRAHDLMPGMYDSKDELINGTVTGEAAEVFRRFAQVLGMLKVNPKRALEELNLDWTASQNIADVMMQRFGIPFREGHHFASLLVTYARERELTPATLPYADAKAVYEKMVREEKLAIPAAFPFDEEAFGELLDPRSIVEGRRTKGGPQKAELGRMMKECEGCIAADAAWEKAAGERMNGAVAKLDREFEALCRA
ncbi:MAG: argininosuccinate lyase [Burkholderia sp.]|jgi:argininosuccinate lyase